MRVKCGPVHILKDPERDPLLIVSSIVDRLGHAGLCSDRRTVIGTPAMRTIRKLDPLLTTSLMFTTAVLITALLTA